MKLIQIKATLYQMYPLKGVVNELNMPKRRLKAANMSFVVYFYFHFNCHQPIDLHISLEMMQNCTFQFDFNSYAHNNHKAHNRILAFIYKLHKNEQCCNFQSSSSLLLLVRALIDLILIDSFVLHTKKFQKHDLHFLHVIVKIIS